MRGCIALLAAIGSPAAVSEKAPVVSEAGPANCAATGLNMKYEAFIAGVNAGEANLLLTRENDSYRVEGTARSKGLWESIQQWRAEYSIDGKLLSSVAQGSGPATLPVPGHFYSLQTTPKKRREIHIEDGVLSEIKNHNVRDPRPAQTGYDLLSALFFLPACHASARVHTGRDGYEFTRVEGVAGQPSDQDTDPQLCNYAVVDEGGQRYKLGLTHGQYAGFSVPATILVRGPLPGRMVLVAATPLTAASECR